MLEKLYLTPYIETNQIQKAVNLSSVIPLTENKITSYSGYLTVNKEYNSNLFFWYFPAIEDPENAPVVYWLQGWSTSSLFGLFEEHGPYYVDQDGLHEREFSWHKFCHMVYIDSIVGTGFSFTESEMGYATNQTQVSQNLLNAVNQFFILFPNLKQNNLFIGGESYGGKYVPSLSYAIHESKKFNLKGLFIGNPWSDPEIQLNFGDYLYQIGLIDINDQLYYKNRQAEILEEIKKENYSKATQILGEILFPPEGTYFNKVSGFQQVYNYNTLHRKKEIWKNFLKQNNIRKNLHTGNTTFDEGKNAMYYLTVDFMKTTKPIYEKLLENYEVMFYAGQWDIACSYPLISKLACSMKWSGAELFKLAKREIWYDEDDDIAGYIKNDGNLTEVMVRKASHMAPIEQPKNIYNLVHSFVTSQYLFKKNKNIVS